MKSSYTNIIQASLNGTLAVTTPALLKLSAIYQLGHTPHLYHPKSKATHIMGWGYKRSGKKADKLAEKHRLTRILAEEGFLAFGQPGTAALQYIFDTHGLHYHPNRPSLIDRLLQQADTPSVRTQARLLMDMIKTHNLSKFNHQKLPTQLPTKPFILLCDQVPGDQSLIESNATQKRFDAMLASIKQTWPTHDIVIRVHPKATKGHYKEQTGVRLHKGVDAPGPWLKAADHVVTVSSQLGFEALIHGTNVTCWGTPFYANRGLTRDIGAQPGYQRQQTDLEQLVGAALILAPTSFDPLTGLPITTLELARHLIAVRKHQTTIQGPIAPTGFSKRKTTYLSRFAPTASINPTGTPVGWGKEKAPIRIEDGFVRSKGLGADLTPPLSWIVDTTGGIHFDYTRPSLCEHLLNTHPITDDLTRRGKAIRSRLITGNITKYNTDIQTPETKDISPYHLVLGQVEGDASLAHSSIKTNKDLIDQVRSTVDANFIYRPHPDVTGGLRMGPTPDGITVDTTTSLLSLIKNATAVHVMTSQGGLEALIRGKPVYCHGPAFYAGWGLTQDSITFDRRTRELSLDNLIAILYDELPLYNDPNTNTPLSFDQAMTLLEGQTYRPPSQIRRWIASYIAKRREQQANIA